MPGGHAVLVSLNGHGRANIVRLVAKLANIKVALRSMNYVCNFNARTFAFCINAIDFSVEYVESECCNMYIELFSAMFIPLATMLSGIQQ